MATAYIAFARAMDGPAPVVGIKPDASESITTSGSNQRTTAAAKNGGMVSITVTGGNVWFIVGVTDAEATAAAGTGWLILDGQTREFGHVPPGARGAVIDA